MFGSNASLYVNTCVTAINLLFPAVVIAGPAGEEQIASLILSTKDL